MTRNEREALRKYTISLIDIISDPLADLSHIFGTYIPEETEEWVNAGFPLKSLPMLVEKLRDAVDAQLEDGDGSPSDFSLN